MGEFTSDIEAVLAPIPEGPQVLRERKTFEPGHAAPAGDPAEPETCTALRR